VHLPDSLIEEARRGRILLFLGAGATVGARHPNGDTPPLGAHLSRLIADRFLGGKFGDRPLDKVSELAISQFDLMTVQTYVRDLFGEFTPAGFHMLVPTFRWRAIFTTNFDQVIERAYEDQDRRVQRLVPFISNLQKVDDFTRSQDDLLLYKLHGCISRIDDPNLPLLLTPDQYVSARDGRTRLFERLIDLGHECPIVFVGHELYDSDIRSVLGELEKAAAARPRYYLVRPHIDELERHLWEGKRITTLDGTLEDFIGALDEAIPKEIRPLLSEAHYDHPIQVHFALNLELSPSHLRFLNDEVDYVHRSLPIPDESARAFYRGFNLGWFPIQQGLDVRRHLTDKLLGEVILVNDSDRPTESDFYAVLAEAGAGKTTFLRRLAFEAGVEWDCLCLYVREYGRLDHEAIYELARVTNKRIFLFVDDAADKVGELVSLIRFCRNQRLKVTIISAERLNEWNVSGGALGDFVNETYKLRYLSTPEIEVLVDKLARHKSLGTLAGLSRAEQIEEFEKRAGRQLLVALHEATSGRQFEDILIDEYNQISPRHAQSIYLTICILHRLGVAVRAGVIFRSHQVPFTDFRERFLLPLEKVVAVKYHSPTGDYMYTTRHPEIAEVVFERILRDPDERFNEYVRVLSSLNISFESDSEAFRHLTRARNVLALFPDHEAAKEIYRIAEMVAAEHVYRVHQQGIYEMQRPSGNLDRAYELFKDAQERMPQYRPVKHSLAELARKQALLVDSPFRKARYRAEAEALAFELLEDGVAKEYPRHTLVKMAMDELREIAADPGASDGDIEKAVDKVENYLVRGLQESPGNGALLNSEADLRDFLRQETRVISALERAFKANRRQGHVALRLAKLYSSNGDRDRGIDLLREALDANRGDMRLHFQLAMELKEIAGTSLDTLLHHLKRSYTPGDGNFEAQFWHARYLFERGEDGDQDEARKLFRDLRRAPVAHDRRTKIRSYVLDGLRPQTFTGVVLRKDEGFGFIKDDRTGREIFVHGDNVRDEVWQGLNKGAPVSFNVGFNLGGPIGTGVERQ
jgi:cold shock CspA family protein/tetratricopeptide (TPR) repeat protein